MTKKILLTFFIDWPLGINSKFFLHGQHNIYFGDDDWQIVELENL